MAGGVAMDCRLQGYPSPLLISYILEGLRCWWWGLVPVLEVAQRWLCWAGIWGIITSVATNHTMRVAFNPSSSNAQLGAIPASTTEPKSCPSTCPLKEVCYAKFHFQGANWRKVSETGLLWSEFLSKVRKIARGQIWRHNVSGDLPADAEGNINLEDLRALLVATADVKVTPTLTTF